MVRRPSVRRRPSPVVVVHTFKLEYLWSHLANLDQILYVASLGWGEGCVRFWGRLDQNSGFHSNKKLPLAYNGENDVSTFSRLFLIRSFLYLQVTRTCIKYRTSSNFCHIGPLTTKLACPWMTKILHFRTWISLKPVGQSWSNLMCSITGGGERLHSVLRQTG